MRGPPVSRVNTDRGIALVVVLWVLALLAMVAASLTIGTRTGVRLAGNLESGARAEALADAGVARALITLSTRQRAGRRGEVEQTNTGESVAELVERRPELEDVIARRAGAEALLAAMPLNEASWPVDGTPVTWVFDDAVLTLAVADEGGKVDLNAARDELLEGLFESIGLGPDEATALTDAVRDYTDDDDLRRANGVEAADYRAAGLAEPKNARFEAVQELLQVYGMTPDLYRALAPALTVYSGRPGIDPRVAPPAALLALPGNDEVAVADLMAARAEDPNATSQLSGRDQLVSRSRGRVFTIEAEAVTDDGGRFLRGAVVRLAGRREHPFQILRWERHAAPPPLEPADLDDIEPDE